MLLVRVLSALIGVPILLLVLAAGGWILFGGVLIVVLTAQAEFYALLARRGYMGSKIIGFVGALLVLGLAFSDRLEIISHVLMGLVVVLFLAEISRGKIDSSINSIAGTLMGVLYPALPLSYVFLLGDANVFPLLFVFIITWINDTSAYFVGRAMGRRKLLPLISPNKTIEGAVGGLLACTIIAPFFTIALEIPAWYLAGIGFSLGCAAQAGDLFESLLKRYAGVKDSGRLIPGHGGMLDRFDGILFALPLGFLLFRIAGLV